MVMSGALMSVCECVCFSSDAAFLLFVFVVFECGWDCVCAFVRMCDCVSG